MSRHVVILGASHGSAPVDVREQLVAVALRPDAFSVRPDGPITELALLSTCNRVEIVAVGPDPDTLLDAVRGTVARIVGVEPSWIRAYMRVHADEAAFRHLFRVAASLESIVVGEPQILGQVKKAYETLDAQGFVGPVLHRAFHRAFYTAKRVRTETRIAENAVSVSYAAVERARHTFGALHERSVAVVGAGKMGALAVRHLMHAGVRDVRLLNRSLDRADDLRRQLHEDGDSTTITVLPLDALQETVRDVDIVITSTGASTFLIVPAMLDARRGVARPLVLIDIAVPRDIDPACASVTGVSLYDVDDLERVIERNLDFRRDEARRAAVICAHEAREMARWLEVAEKVPTIVALRQRITQLTQDELDRHIRGNPKLSDEARLVAEKFALSLVSKILHEPTVALRTADLRAHVDMRDAVSALFDLATEAQAAPSPPVDPSSEPST